MSDDGRLYSVNCDRCSRPVLCASRIRDEDIRRLLDHLRRCWPGKTLPESGDLSDILSWFAVHQLP